MSWLEPMLTAETKMVFTPRSLRNGMSRLHVGGSARESMIWALFGGAFPRSW